MTLLVSAILNGIETIPANRSTAAFHAIQGENDLP